MYNKALHRTAMALRFITTGELGVTFTTSRVGYAHHKEL